MRILVVEDEPAIADFVARGLRGEGFEVQVAADGVQGARLALTAPDLVVLDVMLPGRDGLSVVSEMRAAGIDAPVIMLTARSEVHDRVAGLDAGATDYLVKPFAFAELAARVRAHLRMPADRGARLRAGALELDLARRVAVHAGEEVALAPRETDLLAALLRAPGQVLSRARLLSEVWGLDFDPQTNVVEVYIGYLRRKLGRIGAAERIQTVRSVGYRLRA